MKLITALLAGLIFGIGLIVSGMANPVKVLGFLDIAGAWDPSLAFVMASAVPVALVGFRLARRRRSSLLGEAMNLPDGQAIDRRLLGGAALFGVGWGIAGFCPGPALVALGMGGVTSARAFLFVLAMVGGMAVFEVIERRRLS